MEKAIILLLEDEVQICERFKRILEREGYEVVWFNILREAAFKIQEGYYYDILLSDLSFSGDKPDWDIIDIFKISRKMMPNAPIVVFSAYSYRAYKKPLLFM